MYSSTASIVIRAPKERVWDALTQPELVKKYFFGTTLKTAWKVGSPLTFSGEWEGKSYEDRGTVLAFQPGRTLSYDYWSAFSGTEDVKQKRQIISYDVEDTAEGVRVTIRQSNVDTQERADHSAENWKKVLGDLKKLLES